MPNSLAYLTESRDWHGRWTSGDAGSPPDRTRITKATFSIVSFTAAPSQQRSNSNMASSLHYGGRKALVNLLQTMTANGSAKGGILKAALQNSGMSETAASHLATAASSLRDAPTPENTKRALDSISTAAKDIGPDKLKSTLNDAAQAVGEAAEKAAAEAKKVAEEKAAANEAPSSADSILKPLALAEAVQKEAIKPVYPGETIIGIAAAALAAGPVAAAGAAGRAILRQVLPDAKQPEPAAAPEPAPASAKPSEAAPAEAPKNEEATLSEDRQKHILDGEGKDGGHRSGTGKPGKSEFPSNWSDDKVAEAIKDVANDPASASSPAKGGRTFVTGTRDGVEIRVLIGRDKKTIVTAYPTNTPRNPE